MNNPLTNKFSIDDPQSIRNGLRNELPQTLNNIEHLFLKSDIRYRIIKRGNDVFVTTRDYDPRRANLTVDENDNVTDVQWH